MNRRPIAITLLVDQTGSMSVRRDETIESINAYIADRVQEWKGNGQVYLVTLAKFSSAISGMIKVDHRAVPVSEVKQLTRETYQPVGFTPLYDAVGKAIAETERALADMPGDPAVLFVIITDGQENVSREFSREQVASLIETKTAEGWDFVFLGVEMDAWSSASQISISSAGTRSFGDMGIAMRTLSKSTTSYAQSGVLTDDFWDQEQFNVAQDQ